MRHLLLLMLLAAAPGAAAPPQPQPGLGVGAAGPPGGHCRVRSDHAAHGPRKGVVPRKLGELPPADLMLAVYRTENGCPVPTIVRKGVGALE